MAADFQTLQEMVQLARSHLGRGEWDYLIGAADSETTMKRNRLAFDRLALGNTNTVTMTIGGTADVTLPAFPTARGTTSTATLRFDGGTLKPAAASATYMGGLTNAFIEDGGAGINTTNGTWSAVKSR